ncbi:MAG: restriction endonuclease subunit S, partial [bacterium]
LLHGMNLLLIRINEKFSTPEFINYVFNHLYFIGFFKKICKRAVNQSSINQANLKSIPIPLPPLSEQQAIADMLSTIDQKIEHHTNKKQKLEELFRTLLHELMTARVRVNDINLDFLKMKE